MLGLEELSQDDRRTVRRARQLERYLTQPFFVTQPFTGHPGKRVALEDAIQDCERILNDEFIQVPESEFYLIGTMGEARGDQTQPSNALESVAPGTKKARA